MPQQNGEEEKKEEEKEGEAMNHATNQVMADEANAVSNLQTFQAEESKEGSGKGGGNGAATDL